MQEALFWKECQKTLEKDFPVEEYTTWIAPLALRENLGTNPLSYSILAPNQFILGWVEENYSSFIKKRLSDITQNVDLIITFEVENEAENLKDTDNRAPLTAANTNGLGVKSPQDQERNTLLKNLTFKTFIEGKSNRIALAAAKQVVKGTEESYNPLFIYGGVGLGKTHLMHAIGNKIKEKSPNMKITYAHSEKFVSDMVKSLQLGAISEFKQHYRSLDALLIDDIQFFANKEQSQEELFHTFNSLLERGSQMILTCDRYPKEIDGLEDRLKSRLGWGLPVIIDPPELETRVAILLSKAESLGQKLDTESAFFIAQKVRSNVRELEGALKRGIASSNFTGRKIEIGLIKD